MLLKNQRDTQLFARRLVNFSKGSNIVICLNGNLGSGKTTFSRYFIQEYLKDAKIKEIPSPTFTLLQVYEYRNIKINHFDFYRLNNEYEAFDLGCEEYFLSNNYCFVEWPEKVNSFLNKKILLKFLFKNLNDSTNGIR